MGTIRKQSTLITLSSFLGGILGMINKAYLFAKFMEPVNFGLAEILVNIGVIYAQFALLGLPNVILKYFPFFKDKANGHQSFLFLIILFTTVGFTIFTIIYIFLKDYILWAYESDSELVSQYYYLGILFGLSYTIYQLFFAYLRSLYFPFFPRFINEVTLRLLITGCITLYAFDLVDFPVFMWIYTASHLLMALLVILYTGFIGHLFLIPQHFSKVTSYIKPMLIHGIYVLLGGFSFTLVMKIDIFMLGAKGLENSAIYAVVASFATFLLFPYRALSNTAAPKIAEYWKEDNLSKMGQLYKRVALLGFIAGLWLFGCIYINLDNIYQLIGRVEYMVGTSVFMYLGFARLFDVMSGLNTAIIVTSRAYKYDLFFNVILLILSILSNYYFIFILDWGINGAAIATMLSIFLYNLVRIIFVYYLTRSHPFSLSMLVVAIIGLAGIGIDFILPQIDYLIVGVEDDYLIYLNVGIDLVLRSFIFTLIFGGLVVALNVSSDIRSFLQVIRNDLIQRISLLRKK